MNETFAVLGKPSEDVEENAQLWICLARCTSWLFSRRLLNATYLTRLVKHEQDKSFFSMKTKKRVSFVFCNTHCGPHLYIWSIGSAASEREQLIWVIFFQDEVRQDAKKKTIFVTLTVSPDSGKGTSLSMQKRQKTECIDPVGVLHQQDLQWIFRGDFVVKGA